MVAFKQWFTLIGLMIFAVSSQAAPRQQNNETDLKDHAKHYLLANLSPFDGKPGAVIASPSKQQPDYYYHWVRDAALVMNTVISLYLNSTNAEEKSQLFSTLRDYVYWVQTIQAEPTPSGSIAEPKYHVNGQPYQGPWGRPQNDGPALRALTLMRFFDLLKDKKQNPELRKLLYNSNYPADSLIKIDLEYTANHWQEHSFDLWEEVKGLHFYTAMAQYEALRRGSTLANAQGDVGAAQWYATQSKYIKKSLNDFWDADKQIIQATIQRSDGIDYKLSGLDVSILLALLHSGTDKDGPFPLDDERVLSTVSKIRENFQSLYPINHKNLTGIVIGRYPEDRYDGTNVSRGNPWNLAGNALGEYYAQLAHAFHAKGCITVSAVNIKFFSQLYALEKIKLADEIQIGNTIQSNHEAFKQIIVLLDGAAHAQLMRLKIHSGAKHHLAEQINQVTGFQQGAKDLTWSYASTLSLLDSLSKKSV